MIKAIEKNAKLLAIFAIACTALVSLVHLSTKSEIKRQEQQQMINSLVSIIPDNNHNNDMYQDCIIIDDRALSPEIEKAYLAKFDDKPVAAALTTTAPDGYNGKIHLLVAINTDGTVSGVRTIKHQETPGLGDKIEKRKSDWIDSFKGKRIASDVDSRWAVRKDGGMFDQFTGATITPRAVVKAIKNSINYFNQHKTTLFAQSGNCQENY
ncbi:electron transport complex subunit RsxG [Thalassotalea ganghwensis]